MPDTEDDAVLLENYIQTVSPRIFDAPDGWPDDIELALIDAVMSIRAVYGTTVDTGVRGAVNRYRRASGRRSWNDLTSLAAIAPEDLQTILANQQKTAGVPKSEAIVTAASRLVESGVVHATDVDPTSTAHRFAYCGTRGLGRITWDYFLMLLGHDGVKADTLVTRFVSQALDRTVDAEDATVAVTAVAARMNLSATSLDHSIWRYMSRPRKD